MRLPLLASAACGALLGAPLLLTPLRERMTPREFAGDHRYVRFVGCDVHYWDEGPRDGPAVLLIHGFGAWAFTWRAQRAALRQAGLRVITVDQLGAGASDRPEAPIYSTEQQARLHLAVLDALDIRWAHLVGHSFGGRVALQLAIFAPERVGALVAICPEAFATARPPIGRVTAMAVVGHALAYYAFSPPLVGPGLRMLSGSGDWVTDEVAAGYAAPLAVRGSVAAQVWQARSPKDGARPVPHNLAAVTQPTLLLWGGGDPVFPAADGQRLAATLSDARLTIFDGVGHLPHEEAEAAVTRSILQFLIS